MFALSERTPTSILNRQLRLSIYTNLTMALSRQFKALLKIGAAFGLAWAFVGTSLAGLFIAVHGGIEEGTIIDWLRSVVSLWLIGGVSGIVTGLLIARVEAGKAAEDISSIRATGMGFLGGFIPWAVLCLGAGVLGEWRGIPEIILLFGGISGAVGGTLCGIAAASTKRLAEPTTTDESHQIEVPHSQPDAP